MSKNTFSLVLNWENLQVVNFNVSKTDLLSVSHLKDPFLLCISMADPNLPGNDLLRLLGIIFSDDITWKDYIESISRSSAKTLVHYAVVDNLSLQNPCLFFAHFQNIPATCGSTLLLYIQRLTINIIRRFSFSEFPTSIKLPPARFSTNTFMSIFRMSNLLWNLGSMNLSTILYWR